MLWAAVLSGYMWEEVEVGYAERRQSSSDLSWGVSGLERGPVGPPVQRKNYEIAVTAAPFQLEIWSLSVKELSWTGSVDLSTGLKDEERVWTFVIWVVKKK